MFESFSLLLEFGLEESILAMNEKPCTGGAQFLKVTNKDKFSRTTNRTLNCEAKAIEVEILRRNMFLSMIVLEYTKNLKCCAAD